jgi:hypothetical protein
MEIMKKKEEFNKMLSINSNNHLDNLGGGLSNIGGVLHGSTVTHLNNNNPAGGSPHSSQQAPPPLSLIIK